MAQGKTEHRVFSRSPATVKVQVTAPPGITIQGSASDISLNGVKVDSEMDLPIDTECTVSLVLEGGEEDLRIQCSGKVARIDDQGMAIEFTGLEADSVEYLQRLVLLNAPNADQTEKEFEEHIGLKPAPGQK